jgi:nitrogen fixation protein FixH
MASASITNENKSMPTAHKAPAGRWIPWVFVGLFGIVLIANGTMITVAISTFTGMETTSPYKKGINYNERLAAAAAQDALGWQASLSAENAGDDGETAISLMLEDGSGAPIVAADVTARIDRPLQDGFEQVITLEEFGGGRYVAAVSLPLKGQWEVQVDAFARGNRYQITDRIQLK